MIRKQKTVIAEDFEYLRPLIERIASDGIPPEAKVVYKARNIIYNFETQGLTLNIKSFRAPSFPNNYIYTYARKSKARRSYENSLELLARGIVCPTPVAYIETGEEGALGKSYFISIAEPYTFDMRWWEHDPKSQNALPGMARLLATLHREGIYHKDFTPGNILVTEQPDGSRKFSLIDLNRMQFGVKSRKKLLKNLAAVNIDSETETARFARLYAHETGLDEADTAAKAVRMLRAYHLRKKRLHALKRIFRH